MHRLQVPGSSPIGHRMTHTRTGTARVQQLGTHGFESCGPMQIRQYTTTTTRSGTQVTSPHLTSPHLTSPHLTSPHLTSPHLTSPHLTVIKPNLVLTEVYFLTLVPMDTEAQALIQILKSILDHRT